MTKSKNNLWVWADWPAPKNVRAGTSTRLGGNSLAPYNELNLAAHVGDKPDTIEQNRIILSNYLNLPSEPVWLEQTHSPNIISIDNAPENHVADGSFTIMKHKVCTIMTADCVPILFCNKEGTAIAAIHAGWKGICWGIIENAIKNFTDPDTILVWIGPCISSEHYEVGKDVYESCISHSASLNTAFRQINDTLWLCDLAYIVRIILKNSGVGLIYECNLCTHKEEELFYSYRRDGITGRTASMIWME